MIQSSVKTVTTTRSVIAEAGESVHDRTTILVGQASGTIYLGGPDVTSVNGFAIDATIVGLSLELGPGDELYAIAGSTLTVHVLATRI